MMQITAPMLARQPFLRGMRADQLEELAVTAAEVMFPAGHRMFADGGYADRFWLVESGRVALDVQVPSEQSAVIGTVGIGGLLGWSWLIPGYRWAFGAVCLVEVRAIEFNAQAVRDQCSTDASLGYELTRRLFPVLAHRLQGTRARLITGSGA
jgi:CRP-like cAMP-binding protein